MIALVRFLENRYRSQPQEGREQNISGLVTQVIQAGERRPDTGRRATEQMYQIYQQGGSTVNVGESQIVAGTRVMHNELQAIRSLIADFIARKPFGILAEVRQHLGKQYLKGNGSGIYNSSHDNTSL